MCECIFVFNKDENDDVTHSRNNHESQFDECMHDYDVYLARYGPVLGSLEVVDFANHRFVSKTNKFVTCE